MLYRDGDRAGKHLSRRRAPRDIHVTFPVMTEQTYSNCLMLPAPADSESKATEFHVDSETSEGSPMKLDRLGPMVVNSDGVSPRTSKQSRSV